MRIERGINKLFQNQIYLDADTSKSNQNEIN